MLHEQLRLPLHRQRPHLFQIRSILQYARGNGFIDLKGFINKLERSNQHLLRVAGRGRRSTALPSTSLFSYFATRRISRDWPGPSGISSE